MPDLHIPAPYNAALLLKSGEVYYGYGVGKPGVALGEICFHTGMTGYQETLSDPSYCSQVITFTFPHIGNVGTNADDMESRKIFAAGCVLREAITPASSFRSETELSQWLEDSGVTGISGIDTRALTRHIRLNGPQNVALVYATDGAEKHSLDTARQALDKHPALEEIELCQQVSTTESYEWQQTAWQADLGYGIMDKPRRHVVAIDYGEKYNILRLLAAHECKVTVVPASTSAEDILALQPDGVFLSNGPGDPITTSRFANPVLQKLMEQSVPIFGICLGHQLLALAVGGRTEKMHQGHRGANQPVQRLEDMAVEITSQNHGFVVCHGSMPDNAKITHLSLFDGTVEGFKLKDKPVLAVQYHPESAPGPHDSRYLFDQFVEMMEAHKSH